MHFSVPADALSFFLFLSLCSSVSALSYPTPYKFPFVPFGLGFADVRSLVKMRRVRKNL